MQPARQTHSSEDQINRHTWAGVAAKPRVSLLLQSITHSKLTALVSNRRQYLILTFPKQFLLAQVIHTQELPNSNQDSALEWSNGCRDLLHRGLEREKEDCEILIKRANITQTFRPDSANGKFTSLYQGFQCKRLIRLCFYRRGNRSALRRQTAAEVTHRAKRAMGTQTQHTAGSVP